MNSIFYRLLGLSLLAFSALVSAPAQAQVQRTFPQNALRGEIRFLMPPDLMINGKPMRLSPGARIKDRDNMLTQSGSLVGKEGKVNYVLDPITPGLIKEVWLLRPDELANKPWPENTREAQTWVFDAISQRWTKR